MLHCVLKFQSSAMFGKGFCLKNKTFQRELDDEFPHQVQGGDYPRSRLCLLSLNYNLGPNCTIFFFHIPLLCHFMQTCWLPGFLLFLKQQMHLPLFWLQPIHFVFSGYFKRVVLIVCVPFLPFSSFSLSPSHFQHSLSHTEAPMHTHKHAVRTHAPPFLSIYSHDISKCAFFPTQHGGGLNEWQDLLCSSLTPVRASSVICVQRWKWAGVTQHARA